MNGGFNKAIISIFKGNFISQIIMILAIPVITRLYTPEQYNSYSIYLSLVNIFVVISCLRLEVAIPIIENEKESDLVYINALLISFFIFFINFLIFIAVYFYSGEWYFLLVPFGVLILGLFNLNHSKYIRKKNFSFISRVRIYQSVVSSTFQIMTGLIYAQLFYLIIGNFLKSSLGVAKLVTLKEVRGLLKELNQHRNFNIIKKYRKYLTISSCEAFLNSIAIYFPVIAFGLLYDKESGAFVMLAMSIIGLPTLMLGRSIASAYHAYAPESYRKGLLSKFTESLIKKLFIFCALPLIIVSIFSPYLFEFILGSKWKMVGEVVQFLTPWFVMQALVSPISLVFQVTDCHKEALYIQIFGVFIRTIGLLVVVLFLKEYSYEYLYLSGFLFYFFYFLRALQRSNIYCFEFIYKYKTFIALAVSMYLAGVFYAS